MAAFERDGTSVIVARVKAVGPDNYGMDLHLPENAFRFARYLSDRSCGPLRQAKGVFRLGMK